MNSAALISLACATCIAQDGQPTTLAANAAVYIMFGVLALMIGGIVSVFVSFARRARRVTEESRVS